MTARLALPLFAPSCQRMSIDSVPRPRPWPLSVAKYVCPICSDVSILNRNAVSLEVRDVTPSCSSVWNMGFPAMVWRPAFSCHFGKMRRTFNQILLRHQGTMTSHTTLTPYFSDSMYRWPHHALQPCSNRKRIEAQVAGFRERDFFASRFLDSGQTHGTLSLLNLLDPLDEHCEKPQLVLKVLSEDFIWFVIDQSRSNLQMRVLQWVFFWIVIFSAEGGGYCEELQDGGIRSARGIELFAPPCGGNIPIREIELFWVTPFELQHRENRVEATQTIEGWSSHPSLFTETLENRSESVEVHDRPMVMSSLLYRRQLPIRSSCQL